MIMEGVYLVKCQHLPGHLASIVKSNPHPVVDLSNLLATNGFLSLQEASLLKPPGNASPDFAMGSQSVMIIVRELRDSGFTIFPCLFAIMIC